MILFNVLHLLNALSPIFCKLSFRTISSKLLQFLKAESAISIKVDGSVMLFKDLQPRNAFFLILRRPSFNTTCLRLQQSLNASLQISKTLESDILWDMFLATHVIRNMYLACYISVLLSMFL